MRLLRSASVRAVLGYVALATAFSWPLPAHLTTHLLGDVGGDTGVYAWNLWVFSHELIDHRHLPFFTTAIFSLDPSADLSLHNYTIFADVLAVPLLPVVGVVGAFNLLYLLMLVVNGYVMFLLARDAGGGNRESWLAGALFAFAPCLVARSTAHFSLVMAAPLVVFVLLLRRMDRRPGWRTASAAGAVVGWAAFCDPYYGVYCLALGAWHWAAGRVQVHFTDGRAAARRARLAVNAGIGICVALVLWVALTGGWSGRVLGVSLSVKALYTPVMLLTILVAARLALRWRPRVALLKEPASFNVPRMAACGAISCSVLLSPLLFALGTRVSEGRYVSAPVFWRSSMPGVDGSALLLPNPNHPLFASISAGWLARLDGGFAENVASLSLVALALIILAAWRAGFRPPKYWTALALVSASLAVGPFLRFAGIRTYVPTPWTLLRYVPVLGGARAPARFMAVVMMAVSVLFALALTALGERFPRHRRRVYIVVAALLLFELLPAPRQLYSADAPAIYATIANDSRDVRVLELPFGVRDGLSSFGNFSAASQFYQTFHHKRLVGGYLSRVSRHRVDSIRRRPILRAVMDLSEGHEVPAETRNRLRELAPSFIERAHLGYIVINRGSASEALVSFAVETLALEKIGTAGLRDLYRPRLEAMPGTAPTDHPAEPEWRGELGRKRHLRVPMIVPTP